MIAPHISRMTNRPCKPDGDLKKLWQTLMPGTPMPACGTAEDDAPPERENAAAAKRPRDANRSDDPA
jgi:hypothetical protein